MRRPKARAGKMACLVFLLSASAAGAQSVAGTVEDARTGDPVMGALIELGLTEHYSLSWEDGSFDLEAPGEGGTRTLIVSAPGYAKRYEPVDMDGRRPVTIRLFPDPIDLGGIEATVVTYKTKLRRRLNRSTSHWYALEGTLLEMSREDNVWDLVANRQGIRYDGLSDYGCPSASLHGRGLVVAL
ncbi:MAG: carboxypeptidase-like regulatory domain-containing protein [Gemmatimonadota bacterium]|nr:carboxypeptidase-like regulatory domain-containing protein [Gemmatimonadota bacterium]